MHDFALSFDILNKRIKRLLDPVSIFAFYFAALVTTEAQAQAPTGFAVPPLPQPGLNTVAAVEPGVTRPSGTPCIVSLFAPRQFEGVKPVPFAYAPPAACNGPWAKVVLEADFDVTAGRQFDRTAIIHLGGLNLYYGSTMEPRRTIAPAWHIERDVTDYAALFSVPGSGDVLIANVVNETYTGRLTASARLLFYPATTAAPAALSPQMVTPISNGVVKLTKDDNRLIKSVVLPTNVERMALEVLAQGQADDEFWYQCVPDEFASEKEDRCGGGGFRQVEIFIDGQRAGIAALFPWIFTGGINPYMWFPAPAPETLNFSPSRIDLTPFAGLLNDGLPHRIEIAVPGVRNYYLVTASLLVWRDAGATSVRGTLLRNTLGAAQARTDLRKVKVGKPDLTGNIDTNVTQKGEVSGTLQTSHGTVVTTVGYTMLFSNRQAFAAKGKARSERLKQATHLRIDTRRTDSSGTTMHRETVFYPLSVVTGHSKAGDVSDETSTVDLALNRRHREVSPTGKLHTSDLSNRIQAHASGQFNRSMRRLLNGSGSSVQHYRIADSAIGCYKRRIVVINNAIAKAKDGCR